MTRRTRTPLTAALVTGVLVLTACAPAAPRETSGSVTSSPDAALTVLADASESAASVATSRALFESAPVVVVASAGDPVAQNVAARAAIELGVPLLIDDATPTTDTADGNDNPSETTPADGSADPSETAPADGARPTDSAPDGGPAASESPATEPTPELPTPDPATPDPATPDPLSEELTRLDATTAVVVGDAAGASVDESLTIVRVEATAKAMTAAIGRPLAEPASADPAAFAAEIAALAPANEAEPAATPTPAADIPAITRPAPLDDTVALALDGAAQLASIATTRAAGIAVHLLTGGSANPQASASVIDALHASDTDKTLAIGAAFASEPALDWKVRTARSGAQLPGGGQLLFADHQFVAIYGTPSTSVLGVLGEQDAAGSVTRAQQVAAPYQALTTKTVVPMFEIIASVASGGPGDDGNFSNELSPESLRPWIDAAADAGMYVVIDLQPGHTDFLTQAKQYQSLLELPNVGLALDPEWRLAPGQRHLHDIGSVSAAEVNSVTHWLADLTNEKGLPQKMLIVHQFRPSMVTDRHALDLSRPEIGMLLHVDGQGGQPDKQATWANLQKDAPAGVAWGWKNFYDEDVPMLTPEQTMTGVHPTPELITYQ